MMQYLPMILVAVLAGLAGWLLGRKRAVEGDTERRATLTAELAATKTRIREWERNCDDLRAEIAKLQAQLMQRGAELAASEASLEAARVQNEEKLTVLQAARDDLSNHFRVLAAEIMEEKSKNFVELNQSSLGQLLTPLQTDLTGFKQKVEEIYISGTKDRSEFAGQLKTLADLNTTMRDETKALTQALKGDSKTQGDWGEMILEQILENAGMVEGLEYERQVSHKDDDGDRVIADVVLKMPNKTYLIVDSKVTLKAYTEYAGATSDAERDSALKAHLAAVRRHIKGLSEKNYQKLYGPASPDFVVMFMPLEGAFMLAVTRDQELCQDAWKANALLVSPSTLLFVIRTIAHLWRQEEQSHNAQEIATRGAKLYDKFVAFAEDLTKVGELLTKAQQSYVDACGKLSEGKGNLVRQTEMLRKLGVKPTKNLPASLTSAIEDDDDADDAISGLLTAPADPAASD